MRLEKLHLANFRNYDDLEFTLSSPLSFFVGENGQGKTNILEAIAFLSLMKSFRTTNVRDLIRFGDTYFRIEVDCVLDIREKEKFEAFVGDEGGKFRRAFLKNKVMVKTVEIFGSVPVVLFSPEQLNLLLLGPDQRRRYLNFVALQHFPRLWHHLLQYGEVLKQRNALLYRVSEGYAQKNELEYWDSKIAEHGAEIIEIRSQVIQHINSYFESTYQDFTETRHSAKIVYLPGCYDMDGEVKDKQASILRQLEDALSRDLRMKTTSVGPHRDNWEVVVDKRNLLSFGSRGQLRMALLSMKFAEKMMHKNESPLILLDDVFSELDEKRSKKMLEFFKDNQTLITTTHISDTLQGDAAETYTIEQGNIIGKI